MVVAEGDKVLTHSRLSGCVGLPPQISVDIFRVENGQTAEVWPVGQTEVLDTPSGNPMFTPDPGALEF